ncbi:hypothetical protein BGW39_004249 [Mortierella sp. 14UC]|nr:hypothetical protein BGW39_004249 [Mortierella sp. 14UC]
MPLLKNSYEDVEFRSLVQRVAKKIGSRQPTSTLEQLKFRMYHYLGNAVRDPLRYIRPELISKCMPVTHWATLLHRDYIVSCYMDEYKPQMLLFLDIIRIMGISPAVLDAIVPSGTISEGILYVLDGEQQVRSIFASQSCIIPGDSEMLDADGVESVIEQVFHAIVNYQNSFTGSQLHLTSAGAQLFNTLKTPKGDQIDLAKVGQLHDCMKQLLQSIPVVPEHFLSQLLWTTALCLEACKDIEEALDTSFTGQDKQQRVLTASMKI